MSGENKIAAELLSLISRYPYRRYVQCISPRDAVSDEDFENNPLSSNYWIDSRQSLRKGKIVNSDYLFELFGIFSNEDGWTVRKEMVNRIRKEHEFYQSVGRVVLNMRGCDLDDWLEELEDPFNLPDELMLYALSKTFDRHTLVVCKERNWSTLHSDGPVSQETLFANCHVQLVYLGNGVYGELKHKPYSKDLSNPITDEYFNEALMKIRGVGRPRKNPLDLSLPKEPKDSDHEAKDNQTLSDSDRIYLNEVIKNICLPQPKLSVTQEQTDTSYLFTLYVSPPDEANKSTVSIKGDNENQLGSPLVQADEATSSETDMEKDNAKTDSQEYENVKGENASNINQKNVKGDNSTGVMKGQNKSEHEELKHDSDHDNSGDQSETVNSENENEEKVDNIIVNMWKERALKDKAYVPLKRMTKGDIYDMTRGPVKWEDIDPYSSLEEEKDEVANVPEGSDQKTEPQPDPKSIIGTIYFMRDRKVKVERHSDKPMRSTRSNVNYANLDDDSDDVSPPRTAKKPKVSSEPSADRIATQRRINKTPGVPMPIISPDSDRGRLQKRFSRKDPSTSKPVHRNKRQIADPPIPDNTTPTTPTPTPPPSPDKPKPKGKFSTTEHKLIKHKPTRFFKCPICGMHKSTVSKLNAHFKRRHPPLKCNDCDQVFHTPSSQARHKYSHAEPRHPCNDCGKKFYFPGELKQHRTTHLKVAMHACNHGTCQRRFMNKPDLLKHVRTHTNTPRKCSHCKYESSDPRLFKNHQAMHDDNLKFQCQTCKTKFHHRNQLRRHKLDPNKCRSRSDSPDY